ncbi:MAG: MazG-like family protein [Syntrophomonadaceae bacterium]|nr:MazG-like family protein [Syntrophomonadaceae bacterium]
MISKTLSLPRLNRLNPTLESTTLKLMEEAGELARCIGKFRGLSGENVNMSPDDVMLEVARELLDVAQTAVTMMYVMEENYGLDIDQLLQEHIEKLWRKGYIGQ